MKASEINLLQFLRSATQLTIPIYQRTYSWEKEQCDQLWDDILRAGKDDSIEAHFFGAIVYIEESLSQVGNQEPQFVIDGQQRLTTVSLLLAAIAEITGDEEPIEGFSASKIREYYLLNRLEAGDQRYKLVLSQTDKESLMSIVDKGKEKPAQFSNRIKENFENFQNRLKGLDGDLSPICKGLKKLCVINTALQRGQDNPQRIFESMNATGLNLSQADLIRNFILMDLEVEQQNELYNDYWRPMEIAFGQEAYRAHFDAFMRYYLTIKIGRLPLEKKVYEEFKQNIYERKNKTEDIKDVIKEVKKYAHHYCAIALKAEQDKDLKRAFQNINELKAETSYPLLLQLYHDFKNDILEKDDFLAILEMIESYIFRRAICNIPTNSLNKTFPGLIGKIDTKNYPESIKARFLNMRSYSRFPDDGEFSKNLETHDMYHFSRKNYWLRRFENFDRKEYVDVNKYTIEHIMPQNLTPSWEKELGDDAEKVHEKYVHTIGNLTLTGYNSEYGDKSFIEKRNMEGGFKNSPLHLNEDVRECEKWNEDTIKERAENLIKKAIQIWQRPELPQEILNKYKDQKPEKRQYTLEDHQHLKKRHIRALFEQFRGAVKSLDADIISEEFLKTCIAYKAERSFVDVIPQAERLKLYLNMPFSEINDPRNICSDKSGKGHLGTGDVEVFLSREDGLPYIMGLIRQALDYQMGNEETL